MVRALKEAGGQSIMATAWSPQGTPLVSCDKAGRITFWAPKPESERPPGEQHEQQRRQQAALLPQQLHRLSEQRGNRQTR